MVRPVFSVKANVRNLDRRIRQELGSDLPFAVAKSMTQAMGDAKENIGKNILRKYHRPTRWTQNSTFLKPATKRDLSAMVFFKDRVSRGVPAGRFLKPTVRGTARPHKGFEKKFIRAGIMRAGEYAVPAKGVKLNQYGNMSPALIKKLGKGLEAPQRGGHKIRFFTPDDGAHLPRGIYEARGRWPKRKLKPIMIFVTDKPNYRRLLPFKKIAGKTFNARFPIRFNRNVRQILGRRNR